MPPKRPIRAPIVMQECAYVHHRHRIATVFGQLGNVAHRPVRAPVAQRPAQRQIAGPFGNGAVSHFDARPLRLLLPGRARGLVTAHEGVLPADLELAGRALEAEGRVAE